MAKEGGELQRGEGWEQSLTHPVNFSIFNTEYKERAHRRQEAAHGWKSCLEL